MVGSWNPMIYQGFITSSQVVVVMLPRIAEKIGEKLDPSNSEDGDKVGIPGCWPPDIFSPVDICCEITWCQINLYILIYMAKL